jgi:N-acetylglucosamine-6-phosphate deacetylase
MKLRIAAAALAALALSGCAPGVLGGPAPEGALVIRGGWLFDGTGDSVVRNRGILIRDSVLLLVNQDVPEEALAGAEVVELSDDQYIIPGMFDLHAHYAVDLFGQGRVDDTRVYPALFLANGVTSTFPAGEVSPDKMGELQERLRSGRQAGPRLFRSGPYFGSAREGWTQETTPEQIRREVDYWVARGVHGFKAKGIQPQHLRALIDAAHAHGRTVTGTWTRGCGTR